MNTSRLLACGNRNYTRVDFVQYILNLLNPSVVAPTCVLAFYDTLEQSRGTRDTMQ